jgi:uncharacterized protein
MAVWRSPSTRRTSAKASPSSSAPVQASGFAPNTGATAHIAARHVDQALRRWERRIEVQKVDARPDPSGAIRVEVVYKIVSTGAIERIEHVVAGSPR